MKKLALSSLLQKVSVTLKIDTKTAFNQAVMPELGVPAASSSHLHRAAAYEFLVSTTIFLPGNSAV
ncbi:MAG: hypothetical protein V7K90_31190 [Nostoc sp.]|uniref:hypothetical protein n=1 Tax=Nostoc sp. TaxID=1180 RepID=UPI002FF542DB